MTTFNMVHTADLHLGSLFTSTPEVADQCRAEQLYLLKEILDLCVEREANALLIAGDLFDSMKVERKLLDDVKEMMSHYNFYIFITPGNHDPATPDSCYNEEWPQNVHIFRGGMEKFEIPEKNTCVWGAGFTKTVCDTTLLKDFRPISSRINVLMLHGELTTSEFSDSRYNPISIDAIKNCGADYVALGHKHTCEIHEHNEFLYCYPGTPAGRGFDETGEKGVLLGYASKGYAHMEFRALNGRKYLTEKVDVSGCNTTQQFAGRIVTVLRDRHKESFAHNIYNITLIGAVEDDAYPDVKDISLRLNETLFYAEVTDATTPMLDLELLMNDGTLKGAFVRKMVSKLQSDSRNRDKYIKALLYGLRAFEGEVKIDEDY